MPESPEITRLRADSIYQAKLLVGLRDNLINIRDELEDEGDRVFFGSTNHADDFREIVESLDGFKWGLILDNTKGRDLYAEMRELRDTLKSLEAERDRLREALGHAREAIGSLDEDALGFGQLPFTSPDDEGGRYPLRDELLSAIDAALNHTGEE